MTELTDQQFKVQIKDSPHNKAFTDKLTSLEDRGLDRAEAYTAAKLYAIRLMDGEEIPKDPSKAYLDMDFGSSKDLRADYMWVNDNRVGTPDWSKCPSNGARNIYDDITTNNQMLGKFIDTLPKVLPTGSERSEIERLQGDSHKLIKLNNKIRKAKYKAMGKAIDDLNLSKRGHE